MANIYCVYQQQDEEFIILTDFDNLYQFFTCKEKAILFLNKIYNSVLDDNPQWIEVNEEFRCLNFTYYIGYCNLDDTPIS